jgi:hypothetical protein
MPDETSYGICHARVGLLVLRDCGKPAVANCRLCGRSLCDAHQVLTEDGATCPECIARQEQFGTPADAATAARSRNRYYALYDYDPFYTGSFHYYSDHDYRTLDARPSSQVAETSSGPTGGDGEERGEEGQSADMDDLDDFMES